MKSDGTVLVEVYSRVKRFGSAHKIDYSNSPVYEKLL